MTTESTGFSLAEIGERIRTQDNACTAEPMYVVQQRRRVYGFDPDICDDFTAWINDGHEADADERELLDKAYDIGNRIPDGWVRTAYQDRWDFVTVCFTRAAAERYIDENKHRMTDPRIYVDSGYRNHEWIAIRKFLRRAEDGDQP